MNALRGWHILLLVILLPLAAMAISVDEHVELVLLLDTSRSVSTLFQSNLAAVGEMLATLPPNSCVTVLAISRQSFREPKLLIRRTCVPFSDFTTDSRPSVARLQLRRRWNELSSSLRADEPGTDLVGALHYGAWLLDDHVESTRWIVAWTDCRNTTDPDVSASPALQSSFSLLQRGSINLPRLAGVKVAMVGVDTLGRDPRFMTSLRGYWDLYLRLSGGRLVRFSSQPEWNLFVETAPR